MKRHLTDDTADALLELFFLALPAIDGPELGALLNGVFRIVEHAIEAAVEDERRRWMNGLYAVGEDRLKEDEIWF